MQLIREGEIGRVYCVHSYFYRGRGRDAIQLGQPSEPPAYLNFDLWQGPSPRVAYRDKRVPYNWHWFWQWGNGELGNNGVHVLDICRWGAGVDLPTRVTSSGGRYRYDDDDQQTPDTHAVSFEFPEKVQITCQLVSCTHHQGPYATYYGEKGTIEVGLVNQYTLYDKDDKQVRQVGDGLRHDDVHLGNFLDAVRQDKPASLACDIAEGHKSTMLCHLGNIAQRSDHVLHCDPKTGQVLNDPEAMKLWKGEYAPGWEPTL
jgi:predicted dehydrogenase